MTCIDSFQKELFLLILSRETLKKVLLNLSKILAMSVCLPLEQMGNPCGMDRPHCLGLENHQSLAPGGLMGARSLRHSQNQVS